MPIFEYTCSRCKGNFELLVGTSKRDSVECPKCGTRTLARQISAFAVAGGEHGKGTGGEACGVCSSKSCST